MTTDRPEAQVQAIEARLRQMHPSGVWMSARSDISYLLAALHVAQQRAQQLGLQFALLFTDIEDAVKFDTLKSASMRGLFEKRIEQFRDQVDEILSQPAGPRSETEP